MELIRISIRHFGALLGLACMLHRVIPAPVPFHELEHFLLDPIEPAESSTHFGTDISTNNIRFGERPRRESSWIVMRNRFDTSQSAIERRPATSAAAPQSKLNTGIPQARLASRAAQIQYLDFNKRMQELGDLQVRFFEAANSVLRGDEPRFWPYRDSLSSTAFENNIGSPKRLNGRFGLWPYQVGPNRYLLYQTSSETTPFRMLNGRLPGGSYRVYLGVLRDVGPEGTHIYQYIGAFRAPHRARLSPYRMRALKPTARRIKTMRTVGRSTIQFVFQS